MCVYVVEGSDVNAIMQGIEDKENIEWMVCQSKFGYFTCKTFVVSAHWYLVPEDLLIVEKERELKGKEIKCRKTADLSVPS